MITYAELRNLIVQSRQDDTCDTFDRAVKLFDEYEVPGYLDVFEMTLTTGTDIGDDDMVLLLLEDVRTIATGLLSMQGIVVSEECTIADLITLADATNDISNYEDKVTVERYLELDESTEEIYAGLIHLVSMLPVEKTLSMLSQVTPNFVSLMKQLISVPEEVEPVDEELVTIIDSYLAFKEKILEGKSNYADKFLEQNTTIGLPFAIYVAFYQKENQILHETTAEAYTQVAQDLFALACLSQDGYKNQFIVIKQALSGLYPEISSSTAVDLAVSRIASRFAK